MVASYDSSYPSHDNEEPEALAFALFGRAEMLLDLSKSLPRLSKHGQLEASLAAWIREQLDEVRQEAEFLAALIGSPPSSSHSANN